MLHDMDEDQRSVVTQLDAGSFIPTSTLKSVLTEDMRAVLDPSSYYRCTQQQLQGLATSIRMGWKY